MYFQAGRGGHHLHDVIADAAIVMLLLGQKRMKKSAMHWLRGQHMLHRYTMCYSALIVPGTMIHVHSLSYARVCNVAPAR